MVSCGKTKGKQKGKEKEERKKENKRRTKGKQEENRRKVMVSCGKKDVSEKLLIESTQPTMTCIYDEDSFIHILQLLNISSFLSRIQW